MGASRLCLILPNAFEFSPFPFLKYFAHAAGSVCTPWAVCQDTFPVCPASGRLGPARQPRQRAWSRCDTAGELQPH